MILFEYVEILVYLICSFILLMILIFFNFFFIFRSNYSEKITAYECGFQSFEYSISNFDVKYYIIAVLFLLFDLELIFFLPFILTLNFINIWGVISIIMFFVILILGFFYEWKLQILSFSDVFQLTDKKKIYFKNEI